MSKIIEAIKARAALNDDERNKSENQFQFQGDIHNTVAKVTLGDLFANKDESNLKKAIAEDYEEILKIFDTYLNQKRNQVDAEKIKGAMNNFKKLDISTTSINDTWRKSFATKKVLAEVFDTVADCLAKNNNLRADITEPKTGTGLLYSRKQENANPAITPAMRAIDKKRLLREYMRNLRNLTTKNELKMPEGIMSAADLEQIAKNSQERTDAVKAKTTNDAKTKDAATFGAQVDRQEHMDKLSLKDDQFHWSDQNEKDKGGSLERGILYDGKPVAKIKYVVGAVGGEIVRPSSEVSIEIDDNVVDPAARQAIEQYALEHIAKLASAAGECDVTVNGDLEAQVALGYKLLFKDKLPVFDAPLDAVKDKSEFTKLFAYTPTDVVDDLWDKFNSISQIKEGVAHEMNSNSLIDKRGDNIARDYAIKLQCLKVLLPVEEKYLEDTEKWLKTTGSVYTDSSKEEIVEELRSYIQRAKSKLEALTNMDRLKDPPTSIDKRKTERTKELQSAADAKAEAEYQARKTAADLAEKAAEDSRPKRPSGHGRR